MHRAALLQNKLKTQLFISKITALSPYNDHKSLEAKLAALTNEAGCSSRGAGVGPDGCGKVVVLRAAPESVALGSGTNNVSTPSVAHGAPERPAERL